MTTAPITFVSSMKELLEQSENQDPTKTATCAFELPRTPQLQPRLCLTFTGPEAPVLMQAMLTFYGQLLEHVALKTTK